MTSVHLPFCFRYIDLLLCRVWHLSDLPCGAYALFRLISIEKYVLKSLSVGFQFEGRSLKYSVSMFQRKVGNWKPQAGGHVMGLCRRSTSGRNDLLLSFPTGILSLPLAELFFIFSHAVFCTVPWLTERLEEASLVVTTNHRVSLISLITVIPSAVHDVANTEKISGNVSIMKKRDGKVQLRFPWWSLTCS